MPTVPFFRSELAVVAMLVASIFLMVVPVPTEVLDALLATNIAIAVLLLMVAFYLRTSVQFSTLPTVILIATIFRLSLSVAVTRLVLIQANAGDVIQTFGDFVVGGNVVVGLTIFLIVTVVQFVVITKGAERVSEVAARFSLDALPGKQMAIDADVRSGQLDQAGARERRSALEQESSLYGAMDGAMKFVKGDAIAGLVIIVINLVGGFAVGVLQMGLSASRAAQTYSVLTVGDGLVAQIPALLISVAAGTVVTRVAGGENDNLGADIAAQLTFDGRALWAAAAVVAALAFVPGLPAPFFLILAVSLAFLGRLASRKQGAANAATELTEVAGPRTAVDAIVNRPRIRVLLSKTLDETLDRAAVTRLTNRKCLKLTEALGVPFPEAVVEHGADLLGDRFCVEVDGVVLAETTVLSHGFLLTDDPKNAALAEVKTIPGDPLPGIAAPLWISEDEGRTLATLGVGHIPVAEVIANAVVAVLRRNASMFMGIQEVGAVLASLERDFGDLVKETLKVAPLSRIADVSRCFLEEGIPLRNYRGILEAIGEHAAREADNGALAEAARSGIRRQICAMHADPRRVITAFLLDADAEAALRGSLKQTPAGKILGLSAATSSSIAERIRSEMAKSLGHPAIILTSQEARRHLRSMLSTYGIDASVLSFVDILPDYTLQPIGTIRMAFKNPIMASPTMLPTR